MVTTLQNLELVPGESLGPFHLGRTLFETLPLLRSSQTPVKVSWAQGTPPNEPVLIHVLKPDIKLLFSSNQAQRLVAIELTESASSLTYQSQKWHVREGSSAEKTLLRLFGPTYPSSTSQQHAGLDFLCYPGVAFGIQQNAQGTSTDDLKSVLVTPTGGQETSKCSSIVDVHANLLQTRLAPKRDGFDTAEIQLGEGKTKTTITFRREGEADSIAVTLGATHAEDLLCDFGSPQHVYFKDDDRLAIHRHLSRAPSPMAGPSSPSQGSSQSADQPYFLNHFNLGIDFMMSGSTHRLLKVILHANTPGEVLFGRYEQCPWSMKLVNQEMTVQSSDPASTVVQQLSSLSDAPVTKSAESSGKKAMKNSNRNNTSTTQETFRLDRTADLPDDLLVGKETDLLGFPGVVLERTDSDRVETLWLLDADSTQ